jgi:hypothetical protein
MYHRWHALLDILGGLAIAAVAITVLLPTLWWFVSVLKEITP